MSSIYKYAKQDETKNMLSAVATKKKKTGRQFGTAIQIIYHAPEYTKSSQ